MNGKGPVFSGLRGSRMMNKYFLAGILALLGSTGLAHGQVALGTPVTSENYLEPGYGPYAPAIYPSDCRPDCKPKPSHPILGQIARAMMTPIRAAAGHLLPPCPVEVPTKQEVARMIVDGGYSPAEITAAKIRIDEVQAKARRAAVKYLGTVDCHYYPEAEVGLIAALRADRAETVRYEAAVALGNCRGLTEKMLESLNIAALGVELDGNPAETSDRVRGAAHAALYRCACRGLCLPPDEAQMPPGADWLPPYIQPTAYYEPKYVPVVPPALQQERDLAATVSTHPKIATTPTGTRTLYQFLQSFTAGRESPRDTRKGVDPRLRGLAPLGSETLAIPTTPPIPVSPMMLYNSHE
jgi:hypothetical protein